jgi:hypothetical protein
MQRSGMEWLYRLLQAPDRMARRYLVRGPRIFALLRHAEIRLRQPLALSRRFQSGVATHAIIE